MNSSQVTWLKAEAANWVKVIIVIAALVMFVLTVNLTRETLGPFLAKYFWGLTGSEDTAYIAYAVGSFGVQAYVAYSFVRDEWGARLRSRFMPINFIMTIVRMAIALFLIGQLERVFGAALSGT